jgi:hypothetical protein
LRESQREENWRKFLKYLEEFGEPLQFFGTSGLKESLSSSSIHANRPYSVSSACIANDLWASH